jgi:hypothetical protein
MVGVSACTYSSTSKKFEPGSEYEYLMAIGTKSKVEEFKMEWDRGNNKDIGILLGYPRCCTEFFDKIWVKEKYLDTTWHMALNSRNVKHDSNFVELVLKFQTNVLWRWIGVRLVPHLPCSFDCIPSIDLGNDFLELGIRMGYKDEMEWLKEILSWSVEWSALHGIGEIKNPLFKISTRVDATPTKYVVKVGSNTAIADSG